MNPLLREREVEFLLYEVLHAEELCALPAFRNHGRDTFDMFIREARRLAREVLFPAYRPMDEAPPKLSDGRVVVHERMKAMYPRLVALGLVAATRPEDVGGQQLPLTVSTFANVYLMAANLSACGYIGLTTGAGHLIEAFGDAFLRETFLPKLYDGTWTGTMALTEPHAGSSLADVTTVATPAGDGTYRIRGAKIFISGGDHDLTENIVHMTLARIEGAPAGIKGVSLFAVPKNRPEGDALVPNDVAVAGVIHKIGWRGLPSLAMAYGDHNECRGWLVGQEHRGISYMFQMMNEARLMVGLNGVATASVAYHESLEYARTRPQGRTLAAKDPRTPQVAIIAHADVRRMLLRQKAIVEGGLALIATASRFADLAAHATDEAVRTRSQHLLDLLTPVAKSFPAERGFESNALALQVHGGYGYSSEYLPEAWLRDQKLNSIHEGTTGIQSLDLLGRKVVASGGLPLQLLREEIARVCASPALDASWTSAVSIAADRVIALTMELGARGMSGDVDGMLLHSADYLELFSILVIAWMWLAQAACAVGKADPFYEGKLAAAQYWIRTELPRIEHLASLCASAEDSYARVAAEAL